MTDTKPEQIDTTVFTPVVESALNAFLIHVVYTELMIKRARLIIHKREVGAARTELRKAERKARAQCEEAEPFYCYSDSPCGTGSCKFAQADLQFLQIATPPGSSKLKSRPQESEHGPYSLEKSVLPLYEIRRTEGS